MHTAARLGDSEVWVFMRRVGANGALRVVLEKKVPVSIIRTLQQVGARFEQLESVSGCHCIVCAVAVTRMSETRSVVVVGPAAQA